MHRNLRVHKSMGPDVIHPQVPRELVGEVVKLPTIILEKSCGRPFKMPLTGRGETLTQFLKREKRKI